MTPYPRWRSLSLAAAALFGAVLFIGAAEAETMSGRAPVASTPASSQVRYKTIEVEGLEVFYREAGAPDAPVILLLHGFPASSFMYRDLIDELSDRFRLIAPDYPGFGYSAAPSTQQFSYTFDRLAHVIEAFTDKLGLRTYGLYMQDFGGPVGFRLASRRPERVSFLIAQNANAYAEGLPDSFWAAPRALWQDPSPANYGKIREAAMSDEALEWNYTHGVQDPARISPESWVLQKALLSRPGNKEAMLALLYDYRTNLDHYPRWSRYFREHRPPMLIAWGKNDVIFPPTGARAYLQDLPDAELHLLDTGHFALEDHSVVIARLIRDFFDANVQRR